MIQVEQLLTAAAVRSILEYPNGGREWSVQGFGMLRTYLDEQHTYRLNIWTDELASPGVSLIHDHPWHFHSWILAGKLTNEIFKEGLGTLHSPGEWYEWGLLVPGPDSNCRPISGSPVRMYVTEAMTYGFYNNEYSQMKD